MSRVKRKRASLLLAGLGKGTARSAREQLRALLARDSHFRFRQPSG